MRQAQEPNRRQTARTVSIAAPLGGWNARDSLADMKESDAVILTNWFPGTSDVIMRKGYSQYATGLTGQVESLMNYSGGAINQLFAAANNSFYKILGGAVGAAAITGLTNNRWEYQNVSTAGGNFMLTVNGTDKLRGYNGTTWWTDGDATHDVTGVDTATISDITLFKNRVWMIQANTLNAWYLPTSSIAGAAQQFPLQSVAHEGGYLVAMGAWTIDAGYGVDDLMVFVTNKGEVIVYRGTDPASINTWALVGVWALGSPVGKRCLMKFGGDLLFISQDGLVPMGTALQSSRVNPRVSLTDKIQWAVSQAVTNYGQNYGWQCSYFPKENMLLLNVPVKEGSTQEQYVMNSITKSWCRFTGFNANCWIVYGDFLYFGANGFIGKAWDTQADNGNNINAEAQQAFSYFGSPGKQKQFTMARPTILTNGLPQLLVKMNLDYTTASNYAPLSYSGTAYAVWDTAQWDIGQWGDILSVQRNWQGLTGIGFAGSIEFEVASNSIETHWVSTDIVFNEGGTL